tara:strand:- start:1470 stop:1820 length:351 start_codon:yes stop_codon:yes gene_type:complete
LSTSLTGCASWDLFGARVKPVEVIAKPIEKTPLRIADPDPLSLKSIEWTVITKDNAEEVFAKLEENKDSVVLFGLTSDGYQQLSMTIAEMRTLIATQRQIIIKYKEYYEPKKEEAK